MEQISETESPLDTVAGEKEIQVMKTDGTSVTVTVRQIPVRHLKKYAEVQDDEAAQAEFLCGMDTGWADSLTNESVEQIIVEGDRLNADFFARWMARRLAKQEKLMPGVLERALSNAIQKPSNAESVKVNGTLPKALSQLQSRSAPGLPRE